MENTRKRSRDEDLFDDTYKRIKLKNELENYYKFVHNFDEDPNISKYLKDLWEKSKYYYDTMNTDDGYETIQNIALFFKLKKENAKIAHDNSNIDLRRKIELNTSMVKIEDLIIKNQYMATHEIMDLFFMTKSLLEDGKVDEAWNIYVKLFGEINKFYQN